MVVGAFPIAKLAALAFRQLSKPLANKIKNGAKASPFFRKYVCMPPAQIYHWVEVNVKMRMLNLGKPAEVPKLNETMAIELGSELLGEVIIFMCAAATILAEYLRQVRNERIKEAAKEDRYKTLETDIEDLRLLVDRHEAEIRHLTRVSHVYDRRFPKSSPDSKVEPKKTSKDHSATNGSKDEAQNGVVAQTSRSTLESALEEVGNNLNWKT